jgi:hypothetical protein
VVGALRQTAPGSALVRALTAAPDLGGWADAKRLLRKHACQDRSLSGQFAVNRPGLRSGGSRLRITFRPFVDFASLFALLLSGLPEFKGEKWCKDGWPAQSLADHGRCPAPA